MNKNSVLIFITLFLIHKTCIGITQFKSELRKVSIVLPYAGNDPPYYTVDKEDKLNGGIGPDILKAVFSQMSVELSYVILKRAILLIQEKDRYDCIAPTPPELRGKEGFFESKEIFATYNNTAIVLASSHFDISSINSLSKKEVLAFPGASKYLGTKYAQFVKNNTKNYRELNHLNIAIPMLFLSRVEVLVMDENIFKYQANNQGYDFQQGKNEVIFNPIFPPTHYTIMCTSKALIKIFDAEMMKLQNSGEIDRIKQKNIGSVND